jgi:hypothetical protein
MKIFTMVFNYSLPLINVSSFLSIFVVLSCNFKFKIQCCLAQLNILLILALQEWSRPVREDPSIVLYLERSSSISHGPCYRWSRYPPTWISVFLGFVCFRHGLCGRLSQSIALHDADDIWASVHTIYYFWVIYRADNIPLKEE